jgi:hypothetical protein
MQAEVIPVPKTHHGPGKEECAILHAGCMDAPLPAGHPASCWRVLLRQLRAAARPGAGQVLPAVRHWPLLQNSSLRLPTAQGQAAQASVPQQSYPVLRRPPAKPRCLFWLPAPAQLAMSCPHTRRLWAQAGRATAEHSPELALLRAATCRPAGSLAVAEAQLHAVLLVWRLQELGLGMRPGLGCQARQCRRCHQC